ncbi:MAG: hypothetical protein JSV64_05090 [Candidatus Bathyarchaeota archaeon]|nr:MAG: hypothetical protein JSV64_05090 [Candidatus Bathyarchaeota archaeon]
MAKRTKTKLLGTEKLHRIIDLCRSLEERGLDPFLLDVDNVLETIKELFPEWKNHDELCLDAEAVNEIASAINLQSKWVKHRSTSLHTDPFLIEEKLRKLSKEEIATLFLKSWHPTIELEQISPRSLTEAMTYWQDLVPLGKRWLRTEGSWTKTGIATKKELLAQNIIAEKEFSKELETYWHELKQKAVDGKKIEYWDFIGSETYAETANRAYMASFLVTYGYATLEIDRLEEIVYIKPHETPIPKMGNKQAVSVPIPVSLADWKAWREGRAS